ncbi:hypothetical protein [Larkinella sp. C7]|jgi:hypothetical protein|uniref:hypothetical protein n=1 Tax=Larkinella sp. C7 TaxID=2576607 RepID=UPI0011115686|nr:hypothetical protein [Larkinella sp. C7]
MTNDELSSQRKKARANLELLQMKKRAGLVSQADIDEANQIYQALINYQAPPDVATSDVSTSGGSAVPAAMPVSEFTALLETLTGEKAELHKQMCLRSNQLAQIPDAVNAKALVDEIQDYKARRNEIGAKIAFLKANGRLPDVVADPSPQQEQTAFMESLPGDKYELARLLKDSILPNLSKARAKLALSANEVKKVHYGQKVARLEAEAALVRARMNAL